MSDAALLQRFRDAHQGQVFRFWDQLSSEERTQLLSEAREIDLAEIERLNQTLVQSKSGAAVDLSGLEPPVVMPLPESGGDRARWAQAKAAGEAALRAGQVAAFTVAGGQGTRLGYNGPKGTFPVTPLRGKTLFQVFAEKLLAAGRRYGKPLHWFIMTSHANHAATEAFFQEQRFFGLDAARVHFFRQGRMPAVDFQGKILLETKSSLALSPDGHGGSLRALLRSGAVDLLEREGVRVLSYFQVDNPLVRAIDPAFLGAHLESGSEMSSKMVPKAYPEEKLGHFVRQRGKLVVIEYSDMPAALTQERTPDGKLKYLAGSIAIHALDTKFIRRVAESGEDLSLPFHRADKKIPTIDESGNPVVPAKPNGVKFEMFVFDALPFAKNPLVMETRRSDDFSPVKNAEGLDSPKTCREDQLRQFARWIRANGGQLAVDDTGLPAVPVEVSPLFGYDEDSFADAWSRVQPKPTFSGPTEL